MNNLQDVEEIILTADEQLVILKIEALEDYLEIDQDDLEIVEYDEDGDSDNEFKAQYIDGDTVRYMIFTPEELLSCIKYDLIPREIENATDDLKVNMRNSNYSLDTFSVDEYEIEEYCFNNYEDILDTESRELHTYKGTEYILLKHS
jgi:hypothetical protein